jgi:hypothetical protein
VILLDPSIQVGAAVVFHFGTKDLADRARIRVVAITGYWRGTFPVTDTAPRKNRWAAAMSRVALSMESTRLPSRSIARYR